MIYRFINIKNKRGLGLKIIIKDIVPRVYGYRLLLFPFTLQILLYLIKAGLGIRCVINIKTKACLGTG